jgi:hypothetical protein
MFLIGRKVVKEALAENWQSILVIEQLMEGVCLLGIFWFAINWALLIAMVSFLAQRIIRKWSKLSSFSKTAIVRWMLCSSVVDLVIMTGILVLGFSLLQSDLVTFEGLKELIKVSSLFSIGLILIRGLLILCVKLAGSVQT